MRIHMSVKIPEKYHPLKYMNISIYQTDDNVHFLNISDVILTITDLYKEKE
jgi:hypothetical protein